ncbi:MAG: methylmalonyl Co-A mutase-associated GTPase MeaB [Bacteroidales bacterium]|nr:methylmalonyl Co-A mutase-associated GTPase MeaB [Bacteroidales bacterium]MCL2133789.1 methylmalonyl Co-A mutase-associated GTPase MeaB [Bacteroidales bacterium]
MELIDDSALVVNEGVEQPPIVNPNAAALLKKKQQRLLQVSEYVEGILSGNITLLSKAITLVESRLPEHQAVAQQILEACLPYAGQSVRIGITGVPGAGKSTFIETFGAYLTAKGHKLAVLAIDPSSERTKGSILGDKTRMEKLSINPCAYIRPSPSAGSLGGVARKTRETILLCEAAGFDIIFVETVGVGQSETAVHSMTDFFLLLMISGAGDELQGIKRGIMEMSDLLVINKADGSNVEKAMLAQAQYQSALQLFPLGESVWKPLALTCSSLENVGMEIIHEQIEKYLLQTKTNGYFESRRREQSLYWMYAAINEALKDGFYQHKAIAQQLPACEEQVLSGKISSFAAAKELLDRYHSDTIV